MFVLAWCSDRLSLESQQCCLLTAALIDGPIYPPPTQTSLFIFNLMIKSRRQGWQSAHSSVSTLIMLPMSKLLSPPPRLLPLLEDLPVHAVGLHFRHIVSLLLSYGHLIEQISSTLCLFAHGRFLSRSEASALSKRNQKRKKITQRASFFVNQAF